MYELDEKSVEFLFEGAKLSLENAVNHFETGEILAGKEKFGLAVSHIILAAEECAKSMILYSKYCIPEYKIGNIDFPFDKEKIIKEIDNYDFESIFNDHKPKQRFARLISFFGILISKISPVPLSLFDEVVFGREEISHQEIERLIKIKEKREHNIMKWHKEWQESGEIPDFGLKSIIDWWKQANTTKNEGFYVDFKNEQWKTPQDFTKQDYEIAHENVSGMIVFMDRCLEMQITINSYQQDEAK